MELLSPCGTISSLIAAVAAGADAVYFGLGELNARMKSVDFSTDNLKQWTDYCHLFGVKAYVTLNTEIYQNEIFRMEELVDEINKAGCDAIISADIAVLKYAKSKYDIEIHVSTQAGVKDKEGAAFFKALGADRVVAARECSLKAIKEIAEVIETEVFIHGALCVSFSGNCLLSEHIGGNSANRGLCRQPCRKEYIARDINGNVLKKGYLLSAKDVSMESKLNDLKKAKVSSLKIEGRMKSPEYVFVSTEHYRKLLDGEKANAFELSTVYNRGGFTAGYFNGKNVIYPLTSNHIGSSIGKVLSVKYKGGFPYAEISAKVSKGDGLKILRKGVEVGGSDVTNAAETENGCVIPVSAGVKAGDDVRITKSAALAEKATVRRKIDAKMEFVFGEKAILTASANGETVKVEREYDKTRSLEKENVFSSLKKTGDTDFTVKEFAFSGEGYLPKSQLNSMRKEALESLAEKIINAYVRKTSRNRSNLSVKKKMDLRGDIVEIDRPMDLECDNVVYAPQEYYLKEIRDALEKLKSKYKNVYLKYPLLLSDSEVEATFDILKELDVGVFANNYGTIYKARQKGTRFLAGYGLNISNESALSAIWDADAFIKAIERSLDDFADGYTFAYGRKTLMTFAHCPNAVCRGMDCPTCKHKGEKLIYDDGISKFPLEAVKTKNRCYYSLYSDKIIDLREECEKRYIVIKDEK